MKRIILSIFCFLGLFLASCNKDSETSTTKSSETEVTSFYFMKQDSFPSIGNTTFTISNYASQDTGLITNPDSMTYLTPIDSLVPRVLFKATPSSASIIMKDTSFLLSGKDTIDFTNPVLLRVVSSDLTATKYYRIVVNVHQVDPDLFGWKQLTPAVITNSSASTKGVIFDDLFYLQARSSCRLTVGRGTAARRLSVCLLTAMYARFSLPTMPSTIARTERSIRRLTVCSGRLTT